MLQVSCANSTLNLTTPNCPGVAPNPLPLTAPYRTGWGQRVDFLSFSDQYVEMFVFCEISQVYFQLGKPYWYLEKVQIRSKLYLEKDQKSLRLYVEMFRILWNFRKCTFNLEIHTDV